VHRALFHGARHRFEDRRHAGAPTGVDLTVLVRWLSAGFQVGRSTGVAN
jgi:hypothetical protein